MNFSLYVEQWFIVEGSFTGSRHKQRESDSSSSDERYHASTHPPAAAQTPHGHKTPARRSKSVSVETEDDEYQDDVDPYQNWSTHSAEIAK